MCVCVGVWVGVNHLVLLPHNIKNVNGVLIVTLITNILHGSHSLGEGASNRLNFDVSFFYYYLDYYSAQY